MELVYLWVEDYKNIHKQGFNFSPLFNCEYNDETNELTIDENDDYIENFFGENINVTAIVGKNGSGKSSVLEYLSDSPKFIVTFNDNELHINQSIKIKNLTKYKYFESNILLNDRTYKYFDPYNMFDENTDSEKTYLGNVHKYIIDGCLSCAESELMLMQITMFMTAKNKVKDIIFPKNIIFSFSSFSLNKESLFYSPDLRYVEEDLSYKELIYLYAFDWMNWYINDEKYTNLLKGFLLKNKNIKVSKILFEKFFDENKFTKYLYFQEIFRNFFAFFEKYEGQKPTRPYGEIEYIIPIVDIQEKFIFNYETLVDVPFGNSRFLEYSWDISFSSGELSIINSFAMLYNSLFNDRKITHIYIDEGESFLHPNWQKKYLSYIIQFIKDNFSNRKIQLILTTHSPFLLSDIPKQNIIFLDKDENGNCKVVDGLKEKKQTFGANIHTLLSDSFFMEDGLMGEFAKGKINEIIDFHRVVEKNRHINCLTKIYLHSKQKKFWQTQKIIGEEYLKQVIKNHLVEIEKILLSKDGAKKEEIKRVEAYLESLKK